MLSRTLSIIKNFFSDLLGMDLGNLNIKRRRVFYFLQLLSHVFVKFQKDLGLQMSAALAYTTVLSLVPVCALIVLYTKIAGKLEGYSAGVETWILQTLVADSAEGVISYLESFISNIHAGTLGTVGVGGLLFSTYTVFKTIEKSFNYIWWVKKHRSSWATVQILSTLLILVPASLAASFYLSGKVALISTTVQTFSFVIPFCLTSFALVLIYKLVPNTKVKWKAALIGGIVAAAVFEVAKYAFNVYVAKVLPVNKIYGSIGLIPVFLIWVYVCWSIVLLGTELAFTLQNLQVLRDERRKNATDEKEKLLVHEDWGFLILQKLAQLHLKARQPVSYEDLHQSLNIDGKILKSHLEVLEQENWVSHVETETLIGFVFARPMQTITRKDVVELFRAYLELPPNSKKTDPSEPLYDS